MKGLNCHIDGGGMYYLPLIIHNSWVLTNILFYGGSRKSYTSTRNVRGMERTFFI